ncbi:hypothetical protein LTR10_014295 [Elasticomyces elasticus]|uniref:Mannan endo-1,6-alpha-mannosidase n=1 Tax=Exophiala sideris TaxID=1016849 RepID=A0ABR0JKE1_9EURO|nr:hypothetical protein LTR10_014295 [Elasticomyces elasticus]KAK5034337.1 hypothetical protein LTS07_003257 [Exophiala sideris]KAK5042634.1 hypothetical protein LTR13_001481 [Exophiala sideris]KAK5065716.1 hypothetical protein LTR69_003265 [Exophiala sideris]KAK5185824.1 hypothetical protein LTR44_001873 [Eurotiomycetes sp. CCFEE 6388]
MRLSPLLFVASAMATLTLDIGSRSSIASAASSVAYNMMTYYVGNQSGQVPGILPGSLSCNPNVAGTYCWWEAGAMWGSLINYWQYTNDSTYNSIVSESIQFQRGPQNNFNPPNQSRSMGIDDQVFWAFSALDAVESNFPEAGGDNPSWLALAQGVFNFQTAYWDTATCGGGFRWQVYSFNSGYNLKTLGANGGNFQLSARLAYVTGNSTYGNWANQVWDWMYSSQLMTLSGNSLYIWDSTDTANNCTNADNLVWTYNYGTVLSGAAYMYNYTNGSSVWETRVDQILDTTFTLFFPSEYGGNIMTEMECEPKLICNQDQKSFKAYLARSLAITALLVPSTAPQITPKLQATAQAAAESCNGGVCGEQWYLASYDSTTGVGEEMAALSIIGANLMDSSMIPLKLSTGATSTPDPNAGGSTGTTPSLLFTKPITTADRAGAAILTVLGSAFVLGGVWWLIV